MGRKHLDPEATRQMSLAIPMLPCRFLHLATGASMTPYLPLLLLAHRPSHLHATTMTSLLATIRTTPQLPHLRHRLPSAPSLHPKEPSLVLKAILARTMMLPDTS